MLIRFLSHLVGLDIPWFMNDFFGEFLVLICMFVMFAWIWFEYTGFRKNFLPFISYIFVLWSVLEVDEIMGWAPFQKSHFLEWNFVFFGVAILITGTRLKQYQFPLMAGIFLTLSWLISP